MRNVPHESAAFSFISPKGDKVKDDNMFTSRPSAKDKGRAALRGCAWPKISTWAPSMRTICARSGWRACWTASTHRRILVSEKLFCLCIRISKVINFVRVQSRLEMSTAWTRLVRRQQASGTYNRHKPLGGFQYSGRLQIELTKSESNQAWFVHVWPAWPKVVIQAASVIRWPQPLIQVAADCSRILLLLLTLKPSTILSLIERLLVCSSDDQPSCTHTFIE